MISSQHLWKRLKVMEFTCSNTTILRPVTAKALFRKCFTPKFTNGCWKQKDIGIPITFSTIASASEALEKTVAQIQFNSKYNSYLKKSYLQFLEMSRWVLWEVWAQVRLTVCVLLCRPGRRFQWAPKLLRGTLPGRCWHRWRASWAAWTAPSVGAVGLWSSDGDVKRHLYVTRWGQ